MIKSSENWCHFGKLKVKMVVRTVYREEYVGEMGC